MLQIPNNVMQMGVINPRTKIYMEDYVHTFLERAKGADIWLAFGKKEEREDISYYMIYGVEKKTDWDRGSFPYFKKYERIGTVEGAQNCRMFRPVRGSAVLLEGYFVFYEMNEDMQSYMIVAREAEEAAKREETEEVLEAVRQRREQKREEAGQKPMPKMNREQRITKPPAKRERSWTLAGACRAGSLILLLLLVAAGLNATDSRPFGGKTVGEMLEGIGELSKGSKQAVEAGAMQENGLIVEEVTVGALESSQITETVPEEMPSEVITETEEEQAAAEDGKIIWMIGENAQDGAQVGTQVGAQVGAQESEKGPGTMEGEETGQEVSEEMASESGEEATQAISRPTTYIVKKGDSLAGICREYYGTIEKLEEICTLNEITDPNHIQPGQNLLLP